MKKRLLVLSIIIAMILQCMPITAFASTSAEETITVYMTLFDKGEFCKDKDSQIMWQKPVEVSDINNDGNYSLDEALTATHETYYADGIDGYETKYNPNYGSTSVQKLWGVASEASGYYRNDVMTMAVDQEYISENDKITAFLYYDTKAWSDRYSIFNETEMTVDKGVEFTLTLSYPNWDGTNSPIATAPIGVYDMSDGSFSVPDTLKGEHIFGNYYMTPSTGIDGSVIMSFTEIGKYYVTGQYNSSNYSTYSDTMETTIPNYLVPTICVVNVVDDEIKDVISKIDAIGEVTADSESAITTARTAYDALTEQQKEVVSNINTLINAEKTFADLSGAKEISSAVYTITEDGLLTKVESGTTVAQLLANLTPAENIKVYKNDNSSSPMDNTALVKTGNIVKLLDAQGNVVDSLTVKIKSNLSGGSGSVGSSSKPTTTETEKNDTAVESGWTQNSAGEWTYVTQDGNTTSGWAKINMIWYYFDKATGVMQTNWLKDGNTWYYLGADGGMRTGWYKDGNTWYYSNSSGAMKTGWLKEGSTWYYLKPSGAMATGWALVGNTWYYMNSSGAMQTGWVHTGGKWYYMNSDGAMRTSPLTENGTTYYFNSDGSMK